MIELNYDGHLSIESMRGKSSEELEVVIENMIADGLAEEMISHIDEMSFIDMEHREDGAVHIKAELVLCSKNDIVTNVKRQSVMLAGYGLSEDQILRVLETTVEKSEGF